MRLARPSVVLAIALLSSLAACGGGGATNPDVVNAPGTKAGAATIASAVSSIAVAFHETLVAASADTLTLGASPGAYVVTASAGGLAPVAVAVTAIASGGGRGAVTEWRTGSDTIRQFGRWSLTPIHPKLSPREDESTESGSDSIDRV
jgi:hypothetical protein